MKRGLVPDGGRTVAKQRQRSEAYNVSSEAIARLAAWQLLWATGTCSRSRSTSTVVRVGMAFGEAIAALYILERQRAANEQI